MTLVGVNLSNRQWARPQLTDMDKALLLAMLPGCKAVLIFSYAERDVWEWIRQHIAPSMYVVRLNDLSDLPALKARHDEGYGAIVQLGNEPRNQNEPWGGNMAAYFNWCDQAIAYLRPNCPRWAICPGPLSPGVDFEATLTSSGYQALVSRCEFVPAHAYYQRPEDLIGLAGGVVLRVHQVFPDKRLLITEFCCTAGESGAPRPRHELAGEYVAFAQWCNQQGFIDCLLYFILGSNDPHWEQVGETFDVEMARAIGKIELPKPNEGGDNVTTPTWDYAFADWVAQHPGVAGDCKTDKIIYLNAANLDAGLQIAVQYGTKAKLEWTELTGVMCFPFVK